MVAGSGVEVEVGMEVGVVNARGKDGKDAGPWGISHSLFLFLLPHGRAERNLLTARSPDLNLLPQDPTSAEKRLPAADAEAEPHFCQPSASPGEMLAVLASSP